MTQENEIEDQKNPAYPIKIPLLCVDAEAVEVQPGFSRIEDACIRLKVPKSGKPWLDGLIREAKRDEFAIL